jgi:hypothetical protein
VIQGWLQAIREFFETSDTASRDFVGIVSCRWFGRVESRLLAAAIPQLFDPDDEVALSGFDSEIPEVTEA